LRFALLRDGYPWTVVVSYRHGGPVNQYRLLTSGIEQLLLAPGLGHFALPGRGVCLDSFSCYK
jgi:hypothetical protein